MASPFKSALAANVGTAPVTVYTVPALKVATLIDCSCANVIADASEVKGTVRHVRGGVTINLIKAGPIPVGGAMVVVGGPRKVVLAAGDQLVAVADKLVAMDVSASFLEQDA